MEEYAFLDPDDAPDDSTDDAPDDSTQDGSGDGAGGGLPPLLLELVRQGWFGNLLHWRTGGRVVVAGVGHEDKEEPVVLFAAVTDPLDMPQPG